MRLREFCIFVFIFTILYILFFFLWDWIRDRKMRKKEERRISSLMDDKKYFSFASFYGVQRSLSRELISLAFQELRGQSSFRISEYSLRYQITPYEFVVLVLYFEYFHLIEAKTISMEDDQIQTATYSDQTLMYQYGVSFLEKQSYSSILTKFGNKAKGDLEHLNRYFLVPGVRVIDSNIYYVGGINEA